METTAESRWYQGFSKKAGATTYSCVFQLVWLLGCLSTRERKKKAVQTCFRAHISQLFPPNSQNI